MELRLLGDKLQYSYIYINPIIGIIFPVLFNIKSDIIKHDKLYLITLKAASSLLFRIVFNLHKNPRN